MMLRIRIFTHYPVSHSLALCSADDVTIDWRWRHAQWSDNCDANTWQVISNSLDIDFIHGDIDCQSCKKLWILHSCVCVRSEIGALVHHTAGISFHGGRGRVMCVSSHPQIARFMGPTWGPPGACWPQVGPMSAPWTLLSRPISGSTSRQAVMVTWPAVAGRDSDLLDKCTYV